MVVPQSDVVWTVQRKFSQIFCVILHSRKTQYAFFNVPFCEIIKGLSSFDKVIVLHFLCNCETPLNFLLRNLSLGGRNGVKVKC